MAEAILSLLQSLVFQWLTKVRTAYTYHRELLIWLMIVLIKAHTLIVLHHSYTINWSFHYRTYSVAYVPRYHPLFSQHLIAIILSTVLNDNVARKSMDRTHCTHFNYISTYYRFRYSFSPRHIGNAYRNLMPYIDLFQNDLDQLGEPKTSKHYICIYILYSFKLYLIVCIAYIELTIILNECFRESTILHSVSCSVISVNGRTCW